MKQLRLFAATVFLSLPLVVNAKSNNTSHKASYKEIKEQQLLVELTGKDISKESDMNLYAEMVSAYEADDEIAFKSRMQSLLSRFPSSSYADNALYLAGRLAVNHNNYPEAIRYFGRVEKEYPKSDKVTAATFAKAMTYKKMNLGEFAKRSLVEVRAKYPGSPESFRANAELKMLN
ncbi:tol-pal system YbgF family protein [Bdellovibrio sp. NC01]|uniref:tetratricopeptide repeat protein n=1 Tax=Bdellovibrio sp. NC01 TaxID=2220073 RepID=UPI001157678E|nr:tetratricopeptide repeat protein [Bdellovibrio sp. NC01]QDK38309.1 hypothetical protein DOE51_12340 [Bdellovibrio sp. NC01]